MDGKKTEQVSRTNRLKAVGFDLSTRYTRLKPHNVRHTESGGSLRRSADKNIFAIGMLADERGADCGGSPRKELRR